MCAHLLALAVLCRVDVRGAVNQLRADAFGDLNRVHYEEALLIRGNAAGGEIEWVAGSREDVEFAPIPGLAAVVHTHPDGGFERPSLQDVESAKSLGVPVVVVSKTALWAALPDGTIVSATPQ